MRSPVITIGLDASVRDAVALMRLEQLRHLPVVEAGGRLVGIVTDRDLRQVVFDPAMEARLDRGAEVVGDIPIRDVMTWAVITIASSTDIRDAARLMHEQKIGALPVTDDGRLVGILTESDVLAVFDEVLTSHVTTVRPLRDMAPAPPYEYGFPDPDQSEAEREAGVAGNPGTGEPSPP
jgi:acetoin utilization protein AcuB